MSKSKRKSAARRPSKAAQAISLRLGRAEMQVLQRVAQLAGVSVDTVAAVILAQGVLIELAKLRAARKQP